MRDPNQLFDRDRCGSCGAPVVFLKTENGKLMPCDPAVITVVTTGGKTVRGRVSHFATCPNAAEHRKPKEAPR